VYLTVLAVFIIAFGAVTGGIGVSNGWVYIGDTWNFIAAILLAVLDFMYEAGKLLLKLMLKQEKEEPTLKKPKETNTTEIEAAKVAAVSSFRAMAKIFL
jgi:hypothetical protein